MCIVHARRQGAARSLPEAAARSSGFTSAAAAVRSSYDDNDAAGGCIAGGSVVHADAGSNGWWQGQRELAVVGDSQCGAAWGASTAGARRYDRISGDHWHEEDERANSEDEWEAGGRSHGPASRRELTEDELSDLLYKKKGFIVRKMDQDGNCLFRAISDQIYGDSGMHEEVFFLFQHNFCSHIFAAACRNWRLKPGKLPLLPCRNRGSPAWRRTRRCARSAWTTFWLSAITSPTL
jgi:hypothetical protein